MLVKMSKKIALFFFISILFIWGCTKLDTTNLGGDLVPEVDNVNTFADTLDIITGSGIFDDSTKLSLTEEFALGKITNDPLMGKTEANLYLQLKPPYYPYFIRKVSNDTLVKADSVVLCLSYKAFYGDSSQPIQLQVLQVSEDAHGIWDSVSNYNTINYAPDVDNSLAISAVKTVDIRTMSNFVKIGKSDSVNNQIRIKLTDRFRDSIFSLDTTRNKGFLSDAFFRIFCNGFAIKVLSGNALMYVNLLETQTRLELHYKKKNAGVIDTVYNSFYFNSGLQGETIRRSSVANKIVRTRNALPPADQEIYLQTTPGTYATIEIPELSNYSNKIIHRAEIQVSQIPDPINDKIFPEASYLYVDLIDSTTTLKWKPIYYDLNPNTFYDPDFKTAGYPFFPLNGDVDFGYFGGYVREREMAFGNQSYYNINITRYVQQLVTKHSYNYKMRMFPAHSFSYPQYSAITIPYRNAIAYGRTRIGGGGNSNPAYRMRVRVIYSKIKP
jgi:hypothetical protein